MTAADDQIFQKGKTLTDLQQQLRWRGTLQMAAIRDGVPVYAIDFGVAGGPTSNHGKSVLAIFVADRFEKFVDWPEGMPSSRRVDDFALLFAAADAKPIDITSEEKKLLAESEHKGFDSGLSAAFLAVGGPVLARLEREKVANQPLRDQFNAQRLRLGMTIDDMERVLNAKPLAQGQCDAGMVLIYGSEIDFDLVQPIHYSNILVIVLDGRVVGIRSGWLVPGGSRWREALARLFSDMTYTDIPQKRR